MPSEVGEYDVLAHVFTCTREREQRVKICRQLLLNTNQKKNMFLTLIMINVQIYIGGLFLNRFASVALSGYVRLVTHRGGMHVQRNRLSFERDENETNRTRGANRSVKALQSRGILYLLYHGNDEESSGISRAVVQVPSKKKFFFKLRKSCCGRVI